MDKAFIKKWVVGEISWKRLGKSMAFIILAIYMFLITYGWFFSDSQIFVPPRAGYTNVEPYSRIPVGDGHYIGIRYMHNSVADYTIIYNHGNAEDLGDQEDVFKVYSEHGFSLIAYDYSGYGISTGKPSEQAVYDNVLKVYEYVAEELQVPPEKILVLGKSVGGGPATELASRKKVGGLILESAFMSAFRVRTVVPLVPFDKLNNLSKIKKVTCPVLIMHSRGDTLIGFYHGETLFKKANEPKLNYWMDDLDHNDPKYESEEYWQKIDALLKLIEKKEN